MVLPSSAGNRDVQDTLHESDNLHVEKDDLVEAEEVHRRVPDGTMFILLAQHVLENHYQISFLSYSLRLG